MVLLVLPARVRALWRAVEHRMRTVREVVEGGEGDIERGDITHRFGQSCCCCLKLALRDEGIYPKRAHSSAIKSDASTGTHMLMWGIQRSNALSCLLRISWICSHCSFGGMIITALHMDQAQGCTDGSPDHVWTFRSFGSSMAAVLRSGSARLLRTQDGRQSFRLISHNAILHHSTPMRCGVASPRLHGTAR